MTETASDSTTLIDPKQIDVPAGRRRLDPAWVATLAAEFAAIGQQTPIEVVVSGDRFRLVYGGHRLAAAVRLGQSVKAFVRDEAALTDAGALTLREIAENLIRRELSTLDRAVDIARWREVYEAVHGAVRKGRPGKSSQLATISDDQVDRFAASFSEAARRTLGVNRDAVSRAMRIAAIPEVIRHAISLHEIADNQSELLLLAAQPVERQREIVALITRVALPAASVSDALATLDRKPERPRDAAWQKVAAKFSLLKEAEQDRFFELHEAAIQSWLTRRRAS